MREHNICLPLVLVTDGLFKVKSPSKLKQQSIVFTTAGTDFLGLYIGQLAVPEFQGHPENTFINVVLFLEKKKFEGSKSGD
jgi:hypothetical protein